MFYIGSHISIAKGFAMAADIAIHMNANTFQFFSRNPRGGNVKKINNIDIERFQEIREDNNFGPLLAHAPYTMNLASDKEDVCRFADMIFKEDIIRMDNLGIEYICFHPGSHVGTGVEVGIEKITRALNGLISGNEKIEILLETMSGKGSEIGYDFKQLKSIIDGVKKEIKLGICLDTCHIFSAGYDIVNDLDGVLEEFDEILGLDRIKTIHLNDSMMPFGSNRDRHAPIGEGEIGLDALLKFIVHPKMKGIPIYLETPLDDKGHQREIKMIKSMLKI